MSKPPFIPQEKIGPYILEDFFDFGGMSTLYTTNMENVLIKACYADEASWVLDQFFQEIAILKQLDHCRIIKILNDGVERGCPWYSMEKLRGKSLRQVLNQKKIMDADRALNICKEIAQPIAYIHSREICHCDLKPENIFLDKDNITIIDFGMAKTAKQSINSFPQGTIHYMAPEQIKGQADSRSDVYALGVILYELLAGRPPFGNREEDTIVFEKILDISLKAPALPDIPPEIFAICAKALEKEREKRYSHATEFLNDIKQVLYKGYYSEID